MDHNTVATGWTTPDQPVEHRGPVDQPGPVQDRFGKNGTLAVGLAAAVLSFQIWVQLAKAIGFTAHWTINVGLFVVGLWIAWLYPVAIDVYALLVTREWLRSAPGSRLRKWAKANSIGVIVLSFLGQGAFHAFAGHRPPALFVVLMGGMPPLVVGLTVHLYTMRGQGEGAAPVKVRRRPKRARRSTEFGAQVERPAVPVQDRPTRPAVRTSPRSSQVVHMVWSPTIRAMAGHLDRHYRDETDQPVEIPSRRKVQAEMESNPGDWKWTSAGQVDQAIKAARAIREAGRSSDDEEATG